MGIGSGHQEDPHVMVIQQSGARPQIAFWALVVGLCALFSRVLYKMWFGWFPGWIREDLGLYDRLVKGESYYTHGPLILMVSGIIIALLVARTRIPVKPRAWLGWICAGLSLLLYAAACLIDTNLVRSTALISLLGSLVLMLWGWAALKRLWFPIAFLLFMVPQQMWLISDLNLSLKLRATDWAVEGVKLLGIVASRSGAEVLLSGGKTLVVGNVCSGLRTVISLLAFGALYAFVCRLPGLWRLGIFALALPVALVSNGLRIISIILVAHIWGVEVATGAYHDNSGIVVFILAFLAMFGVEKFVLLAARKLGRPINDAHLYAGARLSEEERGQWRRMLAAAGNRNALVVGVLGIVLGLGAWWLERPRPAVWVGNVAAGALPANLEVEGKSLYSTNIELSEDVLTILGTRDYLYRQYWGLVEPVDMCIIFSRDNPTSTHPPEVCLGAMGGETFLAQDVELDGIPGMGSLGCRELAIREGDQTNYYLYTFKFGNSYTARFGSQQAMLFVQSRFGAAMGGALIRVSTPVNGSLEEARARSMAFMKAAIPYLDKGLK